jgi:Alpha 1,4-glycosyltransferase conserved region/Glycosyltransferase sugar-binding region containing DXD motif
VTDDVVQSLWIGPRLTAMERLSIESFLRHGHEFHLYTYGHVDGVPAGTVVRDGREILPAERIFFYKDQHSVSGFSNFFRYKLLLERGGWWVDADMVCLRPFDFEGAHVFASELSKGVVHVSSGAIRAPRGSEAMSWAWEVCDAKDPQSLRWGETGPTLVAAAVERFGLQSSVQPPETFCPFPYTDWRVLLDPDAPVIPAESVAVHLWNEMWRREGADKDAAYDSGCLYERLKAGVAESQSRRVAEK